MNTYTHTIDPVMLLATCGIVDEFGPRDLFNEMNRQTVLQLFKNGHVDLIEDPNAIDKLGQLSMSFDIPTDWIHWVAQVLISVVENNEVTTGKRNAARNIMRAWRPAFLYIVSGEVGPMDHENRFKPGGADLN
jgi:type III secretion system FlhB-like substrate exporter